jgi:sigma-B regulation protein RsbU (phosphoserine phosphatase)
MAARLNARVVGQQGVTEYLTLAYVHVAQDTGLARFVQAGHPPPLLLRGDGTAEFIGSGGLPVGLIDDAMFHDHTLQLAPGDRLLLYTDGFTEAVLPDGSMLDTVGLLDVVRTVDSGLTGPDFLDALYDVLRDRLAGATEFDDDISAALLEYGQV